MYIHDIANIPTYNTVCKVYLLKVQQSVVGLTSVWLYQPILGYNDCLWSTEIKVPPDTIIVAYAVAIVTHHHAGLILLL